MAGALEQMLICQQNSLRPEEKVVSLAYLSRSVLGDKRTPVGSASTNTVIYSY